MGDFAPFDDTLPHPLPGTSDSDRHLGTIAHRILIVGALLGTLVDVDPATAIPIGNVTDCHDQETGCAAAITMEIGGQQRSFILERPGTQSALPTIIALHGLGGNATELARNTGLGRLGARENFVSVFPDGVGHTWNHFPPGTAPARYTSLLAAQGFTPPDDVAFLREIVAGLVRKGISDPKRIYLAGISAGGFMTLRMTCLDAPMFAAIGLIISGMPEATGAQCHPAKPLPVVMVKGTADPNVPWDGGLVKVHTFTVWSQEQLLTFFRRLDGCTGAAEQSVLPNQTPHPVELVRWTNCTNDGPVEIYRVIGGVHAIPPVPPVTPTLWAFFRDKSR